MTSSLAASEVNIVHSFDLWLWFSSSVCALLLRDSFKDAGPLMQPPLIKIEISAFLLTFESFLLQPRVLESPQRKLLSSCLLYICYSPPNCKTYLFSPPVLLYYLSSIHLWVGVVHGPMCTPVSDLPFNPSYLHTCVIPLKPQKSAWFPRLTLSHRQILFCVFHPLARLILTVNLWRRPWIFKYN